MHQFFIYALAFLIVFRCDAEEEDYPLPPTAKNVGSIRSVEFYWLLNRMCWLGDDLAVQMLLKAGADPNGVSDYRDFIREYPGIEPSWPINQASWKGHNDVISTLLEAGANVDVPEGEGYTALLIATTNNHLETVKILLAAGADQNYIGVGGTALEIARKKGFMEIVNVLDNNE